MSAGHDKIRTALRSGFSINSLRNIEHASLTILREEVSRYPIVPLTLAVLSRWIADSWDEKPISVDVANRVERQLQPHLETLLRVMEHESSPDAVCGALNEAAIAFAAAICSGLDSDVS